MLSHHSQPTESESARNSESEGQVGPPSFHQCFISIIQYKTIMLDVLQMDEELSDQGMETELDPTQLLEVSICLAKFIN